MKEITAQQAYELLQSGSGYIYLDVRSVPEFEQGHAPGAINIPLLHFESTSGMVPNQDFVAVVEATLPHDAKLLVGCKAGGRSARACELMSQMGYSDLSNIRGGFVALTDNTGRVVEPGWSMLNLPSCTECSEDAHYESIAAKAMAK
ncbi:MAG TPA: rhodanese-like domain-containing protein [Blastocatellia bacterium]|nr:rhodanese-like domain-containing protein [Blastocatellia bacterium]